MEETLKAILDDLFYSYAAEINTVTNTAYSRRNPEPQLYRWFVPASRSSLFVQTAVDTVIFKG